MQLTDASASATPDLERFKDEWKAIGFAAEPADRPRAEAALLNIYAAAGLPAPARIVWCGSPLSQGLARAIVLDAELAPQVATSTWNHIMSPDRTKVLSSIAECFRNSMRLFDVGAVKQNLLDAIKRDVRGAMTRRCQSRISAEARAAAGEAVWDSVWNSVWDSIGEAMWNGVDIGLRKMISTQKKEVLDVAILSSLTDLAGDCVKRAVWEDPMDRAWSNIRNSVPAKARVKVWESVWCALQQAIWEDVVTGIGRQVKACGNNSAQCSGYGQHDAHWLAFYAYFREMHGMTAETEPVAALSELAKAAGWFIPHEAICWVCERPAKPQGDTDGCVRGDSLPALRYPDGWCPQANDPVHGSVSLQPA